jgi:phosphatidate cytidylyltransferase
MSWLQNMPGSLLYAIFAVFGLLLFATVTIRLLRSRLPNKDYSELSARIYSWWIMVLIFSLAIVLSRTITLIFFAFITFMAFKEFLSMIPTRRVDHRVLFWAYLSIPVQFYWIHISWYGMFTLFIPLYMFLFLPFRMLLAGETDGFLKAVGTLHWGMMITIFGVSHAAYLLVLPGDEGMLADGASLLFFLVFLTQFNDVAQYFWGKLLGRHFVVPTISSKKTWEGLLGGVSTTVVASMLIAPWLTPLSASMSFYAGLIIGIGGFIGDINISALKRDIGVKDSGTLIPGHGGILDRIDSLSYTAPLFFHFIRYFY